MSGPRFDLSAAPYYIIRGEAAGVANREFDYDVLVKPLEGRMMGAIWRIVRQREAAEDALQDALTLIWKKRSSIALHPKPEALILRMAVMAAIDAVRKISRRLKHETPGLPEDRAGGPDAPFAEDMEGRDLRRLVLNAIGRLPKRQATAVLLHVVEEQSYEDIAQSMGCSESTVRVNVMRGRKALARSLTRDSLRCSGSPARNRMEGSS